MSEGKEDVLICRCEEVTEAEIMAAIRSGCRTIASIKRMTRAGMGACQGRSCGRLIRQILVREKLIAPDAAEADKSRFPVVPCELGRLTGGRYED